MRPIELFRFCPRCGAARADETPTPNPFRCAVCNLSYFFNPTVAAAAFIFAPDGHVLFIRRAKEPSAGKLGLPGGFIDIGESAEDALRREVREEVGLELDRLAFLASFPNTYPYREVTYPVVDLYFTALAVNPDSAQPLDAVAGIEWRQPAEVQEEEIAFCSLQAALHRLREPRRG